MPKQSESLPSGFAASYRLTWLVAFLLTLFLPVGAVHSEQPEPSDASPGKAAVPYQLRLEAMDIDGYPGLHSMAHASYDGKLILLSGRVNGMHGFPVLRTTLSNPSFPKDKQNDMIYVLDLAAGTLLAKASVRQLGKQMVRQLTSTNTEYALQDGFLYVVGGYGDSENGRSLVTLPQAMAINLKELVEAVTNAYDHDRDNPQLDASFTDHIYVGTHPALAITGGDLVRSEPYFLLIFGTVQDKK